MNFAFRHISIKKERDEKKKKRNSIVLQKWDYLCLKLSFRINSTTNSLASLAQLYFWKVRKIWWYRICRVDAMVESWRSHFRRKKVEESWFSGFAINLNAFAKLDWHENQLLIISYYDRRPHQWNIIFLRYTYILVFSVSLKDSKARKTNRSRFWWMNCSSEVI